MAHNKGHSQIFNQQVEAKKVVYSEDKKFREIQEYKFNFTNFFIMTDFGTHPL